MTLNEALVKMYDMYKEYQEFDGVTCEQYLQSAEDDLSDFRMEDMAKMYMSATYFAAPELLVERREIIKTIIENTPHLKEEFEGLIKYFAK